MQAPVNPVTAVGVVSGAGHVIELADAGHHSAGVLLLQGLALRGDERLDSPAQQLLPINAGLVDVVLDLRSGPLHELVALRPGDPPRLSRIYETFGVVGPGQDHSGEEFNPVRCLLCGGSCHGQSGSVLSRWAISSRWAMNTIPANNGRTSGYRRCVDETRDMHA